MESPFASNLTLPLATVAAASRQKQFDAVVVGGGSAGITTARTLVENGKRVALLESGPLELLTHISSTDLRFDPALTRNVQAGYQYSPQAAGGGTFGSLMACFGGRGLFWNGAAPRFNADDFAGWPFKIAALDDAYAWAEQQFRVTRLYSDGRLCQEVCKRLRQRGILGEPGPYAVDVHATSNGWLAGTVGNSLSPLLRSTLLSAPNKLLSLSTRSFATEVMLANKQVKGVKVQDLGGGGAYEVLSGKVVLAAGAFESVRLALASCIPDPNAMVGRYISDHMFVRAYYPIIENLYGPQPEVAIIWVPAGADRSYQLEIHLPADNLFQVQESTLWKPDASAYYAAMVRSFAPVQPRRINYIECLPGTAPGSYRVYLSLDGDDVALQQSQVVALEQVRVALGAGAAQVQIMPGGSSHHEAGGLMLGDDPANSIADSFGRIRGVTGLYAFDSATWPAVSPANPHLTIVALARRQALGMAQEV